MVIIIKCLWQYLVIICFFSFFEFMKVAALIITYNPDLDLLKKNIDAIINQVDHLLVFDNCSANVKGVSQVCSEYKKICLQNSSENIGISKAVNWAEDYFPKEYEWFLTLDQDSICPDNLISEYLRYVPLQDVAMMSPVIQLPSGRLAQSSSSNDEFEYVSKCITSACFVNREAFRDVGKMDEQLFIDNVDHDLCKRFLIRGYRIIRCNNVKLFHNMGSSTPVALFEFLHKYIGTKVVYQTYSPFRIYYLIRNSIYFLRKYCDYSSYTERWYYIKLMVWHVAAKSLVVGPNRWKIVFSILNGIRDGFKMKKSLIKNRK